MFSKFPQIFALSSPLTHISLLFWDSGSSSNTKKKTKQNKKTVKSLLLSTKYVKNSKPFDILWLG